MINVCHIRSSALNTHCFAFLLRFLYTNARQPVPPQAWNHLMCPSLGTAHLGAMLSCPLCLTLVSGSWAQIVWSHSGHQVPPVFLHQLRLNKQEYSDLNLSFRCDCQWVSSRTNGSQFLRHWRSDLLRSSLRYNTGILIFPSLCATSWQKGKCRSSFNFFSDLLFFSQPASHFLFCNLPYFLIPIITSLFCSDVFLFSPTFFCLLLIFPSLSTVVFHPNLILCFLLWTDSDGNLRLKILSREGTETQGSHNLSKRSCSNARFPVSSPLNLPRQFHEWGGRKVAMTTEGLIVSGAFCWWASSWPQSGN